MKPSESFLINRTTQSNTNHPPRYPFRFARPSIKNQNPTQKARTRNPKDSRSITDIVELISFLSKTDD